MQEWEGEGEERRGGIGEGGRGREGRRARD